MHSKTSFGKQDLSFVNHLSLRMVTALFNAALLTANWTVVDGNRTWIACDEGSSGTIAGWQQVRFRTLAVVTWHPVTDQGPTPLGPEDLARTAEYWILDTGREVAGILAGYWILATERRGNGWIQNTQSANC